MRGEMFAIPSLDARRRPAKAEPEFSLRSAPRSGDSTATSNPRMLLGIEGEGGMPVTSRPRSAASRRRTTAAEHPVGNVLYLVLIGAVAIAIIGVFFGSGFLLLAPPAKETVADAGARDGKSPRPHGGAPRADGEAALVSREMAVPQSTAVGAAVPDSPLAHPPTVAKAAPPPQQSNEAESSSPTPSNAAPSQTASEPAPASSSMDAAAPPTRSASPGPSSAQDSVLPGGAKRRQTRDGRSNHTRVASRHSHPRSARSDQALTQPAGHTGSFGQLLTQLAGQTKPIARTLTPPSAEQPDPFAQRVVSK
jgi:hypothetical protein